MRVHRHLVLVLVALFAVGAGTVPEPTVAGAAHLQWLHSGSGWADQSALVHANDDGVVDVAVASGQRIGGYLHTFGGNPAGVVHAMKATASDPATLRMLDGRTGQLQWLHTWRSGEPATDWDPPYRFEFVEGLAAGQLDDRPGNDVLVLRRSWLVAEDGQRIDDIERTTLLDAATGTVRWERAVDTADDGGYSRRQITPVELSGRTVLVLNRAVSRDFGDLTTTVSIVEVGQEGLNVLATLPTLENAFAFLVAAPAPGGVDVYTSEFTVSSDGGAETAGVLRATRVALTGDPTVSQRWALRGRAGGTMGLVDGERPALVVMRDDGTTAHELADGAQRWHHAAAAHPFDASGHVGVGAVNADGVSDVFVSPTLGNTLYRNDFTTTVYALDGERGTVLWQRLEPTGKFGARSYSVGDFDGDGRQEVAAAMLRHDGFPFVGHFDDDPAQISLYDIGDGTPRCHFPVDRLPSRLDAVELSKTQPTELLSVGYSGTVSALRYWSPACDPAG